MEKIKKILYAAQKQQGFTLIELMVVVAIIAILVSIFTIPNVMGATERSRVAIANSDIDTIQQAMDFFSTSNGELPNRKDSSTKNYYSLLYTGMASNGAVLTAVKMENGQGEDQSQAGVLDTADFPLNKRDNLYHHFIVNGRSYPVYREHGEKGASYGWRESYLKLKTSMLDPWGNSYLAVLNNLGDGTVRIIILSAGGDKILDTDPATATIISPNDIGITWITRP